MQDIANEIAGHDQEEDLNSEALNNKKGINALEITTNVDGVGDNNARKEVTQNLDDAEFLYGKFPEVDQCAILYFTI